MGPFIVKNNLLLIAVTEIGVGGVIGLISFVLVVMAALLGVGIAVLFAQAGEAGLIIGIVLAVLIAGTLIALISAFNSYVQTAYHTCLFLWARDVEKAMATGHSVQAVHAPAPVAAVLGA